MGDDVESLLASLIADLTLISEDMARRAATIFQGMEIHHLNQWRAIIRNAIGIEIGGILDRASANEFMQLKALEFSRLIVGVSDDVHAGIARETHAALRTGKTARSLELELIRRFNKELVGDDEAGRKATSLRTKRLLIKRERVAAEKEGRAVKAVVRGRFQSRVTLIARDQTGKLNSQLNQFRQQEAGIEYYIWSDSDDRRVRPSHRAKDNLKFRWDRPPADTGHPGNDVQCRCVARAVLGSLDKTPVRPIRHSPAEDAREYVLTQGNKTGFEHATAYDLKTGKTFAPTTSRKNNFVMPSDAMAKAMLDRKSSISFHHNHPRGTSLSVPDLQAMSFYPGLSEVHAHGKSVRFTASRGTKALTDRVIGAANSRLSGRLNKVFGSKVPPSKENVAKTNRVYAHILNEDLHKRKYIKYEANIKGSKMETETQEVKKWLSKVK